MSPLSATGHSHGLPGVYDLRDPVAVLRFASSLLALRGDAVSARAKVDSSVVAVAEAGGKGWLAAVARNEQRRVVGG